MLFAFHEPKLPPTSGSSFHYKESQQERTGLRMLSKLYKHLPAVRAEYSVTSPEIWEFIAKLKKDIKGRGVTKKPWKLARKVSILVVKIFFCYFDYDYNLVKETSVF